MQLTNVTVTKDLTATTEHGDYQIEYTVNNNELTKVSTSITAKTPSQENNYIGNITYENGNITSNFMSTYTVINFFTDFESFMKEIQSMESNKE